MEAHDLHQFFGGGREGQAALGRHVDGRILVLLGDAAHTAGIAGARAGQGRLEAAQGEVAGRRAVVLHDAVFEDVAHQPVPGEPAQQGAHVLFDAGTRDVAELLALVGIHLAGADVEASPGETHGAVGEQGQQGGVGIAGVGRMGGERMGRSGKGGHGQILGALYLAGPGIQAHGPAAGQEEELALLGQGHEFVRAGRAPFLAAAADHEQVGIIVDIALGIGHDHVRFDASLLPFFLPCGILPCRVRMYISGAAASPGNMGTTAARISARPPHVFLMLFIFLCFSRHACRTVLLLRSQERLNRALRDEHARCVCCCAPWNPAWMPWAAPAPNWPKPPCGYARGTGPPAASELRCACVRRAAPRTPVVDPGLDLHMDSGR